MRPPPPKRAAYGSVCSSCGECCHNQLCPLGTAVFARVDGPCAALGYDDAGKSFCGLIVHPEKFAPIDVALHGRAALSEGAALLCGAGYGCDALKDGETRPPGSQERMLAAIGAVPRAQVARAMRVWRIAR